MEFRLTYPRPLRSHQDSGRLSQRSRHVHDIRRAFHRQLKTLWQEHPAIQQINAAGSGGSSVALYVGSGAACGKRFGELIPNFFGDWLAGLRLT
jgi:hypothetical protein